MMLQAEERKRGEEEETSDYSSGCQSGWTMYLDQSYEPPTSFPIRKVGSLQEGEEEEEEEEEEEDLSMVSDASSGPPHFHEEDDHYCSHYSIQNGCPCSATAPAATLVKNGGKKRRVEAEHQKEACSLLDDTASSPLFSFSKASFNGSTNHMKPSVDGVLEFSCDFSATHYKGKSALRKQMGYLKSSAHVKQPLARQVYKDEGEKKIW